MFIALSASVMAQQGATFTVSSVPVTTVASCGLTEKTGNISFTTVPASPNTLTGTITVTYPVPITIPFARVGILPVGSTVTILSVTNNAAGQGVVTMAVPGNLVAPQSFTLTGVRVSMAGSSLTTVNANISTTGNAITSGETVVNVINSVANGLGTPNLGFSFPLNVNAATGSGLGAITVYFPEGYLNSFGVLPATDATQINSVRVRITVSALPSGVTLTFPAVSGDGNFTLTDSTGVAVGATQTVSTSGTQVYYTLTTDTSPTASDSLTLSVTVAKSVLASYPLPSGAVQLTATLAPIGTAFDAFGGVISTGTGFLIPRYAGTGCEVGPVTIANINPANTVLLIPYAVTATASGYNTGIEIANTTTDPGSAFVSVMGFSKAVAQNGLLTFYFYPQTGTAFSYTTAATSPGQGLASGVLNSGRIYTVLLSELLAAAGAPADFSGYIIVVANFTNAHGQYFISNFDSFTNGSLMLVITGARNGAFETLNN